jgi:hypothetical protein
LRIRGRRMRGPRKGAENEDQVQECQKAVELEFLKFLTAGLNAGWTHTQICLAVMDMADSYVLADAVHTRLDEKVLRLVSAPPRHR